VALVAIAGLLATAALAPPRADAARPLETALFDDRFLDADRERVFDRAERAGAGLVRLPVRWRHIAPRKPASPCNSSDGAYQFGRLDAAVRAARRRGLDVLLTLTQAPDWAEGPGRPKRGRIAPGAWKPNVSAYRGFACAVANRYSGGLLGLPRVRFFESFNEPNLSSHLAPQWQKGKFRAGKIYRRLVNALYEEVKRVHRTNRVVGPSLGPFGKAPRGPQKKRPGTNTKPVFFLRKLWCLNAKLRSTGCPKGRQVKLDVVSHHAINPAGGPAQKAADPLNATTGDMGKIRRHARAAERAGNFASPGRNRPIWVTEFWWQSRPPAQTNSVPLNRHARYVSRVLYTFWKARADLALNFLVEDGALATGLFRASGGKAKPALKAFRFPFVGDRKSRKRVVAWGKSPRGGTVQIQRKGPKRWRTIARASVSAGDVFRRRVQLRGKHRLRATVGGEASRAWQVRR
jgi:hypothetical protein